MELPGKRIQKWREYLGKTPREFEALTGIPYTTLRTLENNTEPGKHNPSYDVLAKLRAACPQLNIDWIFDEGGHEPMLKEGRALTPAPTALRSASIKPDLLIAEEPAAAYGCIAPDMVATLTAEVTELRAENKSLHAEVKQARREAREDLIAQARTYNSVKEDQTVLITRLYAKLDEYELRLGYRQPTQEERQQLQEASGPRMEVKPFGARYREASADEPQASSEGPGGKVLALYPEGVSLCEAA